MKIVIFTSNAIRHKYVANILTKNADDLLVIAECKKNNFCDIEKSKAPLSPIEEHFYLRYKAEKMFFSDHDFFISKTLPLIYKEANSLYTYEVVKKFRPDLMFVFGASLIKEPYLSLLPSGRFINLHLGLSPYYRGSGTNFWPFVNRELEYVGSTILHIDAGIDTGDIITHVLPKIEIGDNVHSIGCKVIKESAQYLSEIINLVKQGKALNRVVQWKAENEKYYTNSDFTLEALNTYKNNLSNGLIEKYLNSKKNKIRYILLNNTK